MGPWRGRLFGAELPAGGSDVEVGIELDALMLRAPRMAPRRVPLRMLDVRSTGFNHGRLELAWRDAGGAWACHLDAAADGTDLLAAWPRDVVPVPQALHRARRQALLPWTALVLVIALPLMLLVALFHSQERVVDYIADQISPSVEQRIGAATLAQIRLGTRFITEGAEARALEEVARQLVAGDRGSYRFHLADDKVVNAFALPGGDIVVHRGLLQATRTPDELAGVLAHEIQHVALRHSLKGLIRSAGLTLLVSTLVGDPGATLSGQAADRLLSLKFSRDAEREADEHGFTLLVNRGIDPKGMVDFFAAMAERQNNAPPALLSTHPASAEREAALAARLKALPAGCCKPLEVAGAWPPR